MDKKSSCELLAVQYLLGNKWTFPILCEFEKNSMSFNELKKRTHNKINSTLLSSTLKKLLNHGILIDRENEKIYSLSSSGKDLIKILNHLKQWGEKNGLDVDKDCKNRSCLECGKFI